MRKNQPLRKRIEILRGINIVLKHRKGTLVSLLLLEVAILILQLIDPYFYKMFIDDVLVNKHIDLLLWVFIGKILIYFVSSGLYVISKNQRFRCNNQIIFDMKQHIWNKFLHMTAAELDVSKAGDLEEVMERDVAMYDKFLGEQVIDYIISCGTIIVSLILLIRIQWKLTLIGCVLIPIPYIVSHLVGKKNYKRQTERRKIYGEYETNLYNTLQSWKEVKALNQEKRQLMKFVDYRHKIARFDIISGYWEVVRDAFNFFNEIIATRILIYFIGGLFVINNKITVGSMLLFATYYEQFYAKFSVVNRSDYEFYNDLPLLEKVIDVLKRDSVMYKQHLEDSWKGEIHFQNVSFTYPNSQREALHNVSFTIKQGEKVAIVGKSGCGKTTMIKLLLGMYRENLKGAIVMNDISITDLDPVSIHDNIGIVMQDSLLFNMSIRENLQMVKNDMTEEEMITVCKNANIYDFIQSLDETFDTVIGEKGVKLSGGQKQRLAIARLFLKLPNTIIFDEATSALDSESEQAIHNALNLISKERTVILIAHRPTTVLLADRVLVVDDGRIVGDGTHQQLIETNAYYKSLFEEQLSGFQRILEGEH